MLTKISIKIDKFASFSTAFRCKLVVVIVVVPVYMWFLRAYDRNDLEQHTLFYFLSPIFTMHMVVDVFEQK